MHRSVVAFGFMLLLGVLASYGFNLDVEEPKVFQEDGAGFGQSVAQFGRSRLVVGAPLEVVAVNQTGRLYECMAATGRCQPISLHTPPEAVNMSLGLSLVASTNLSWLLVIRTIPAALPECPVQEMDIVFLIDGSGSITPNDFKQMKDFVRAMMGQFEGTDTLFSLMQYSNLQDIHFTFSKFQSSSSPLSLVDPIQQLTGLTYTATGILTVVKELFNSKNGARESAKKILIVITDGQKYKDPLEYSEVIPQAEKAGIIRYAIGVGDAFQEPTARQELDTIGSERSEDHVFKVDNFAALSSIQKRLQEKIFAVEGTQSTTSSSFQHEMSQEGFSSVLTARAKWQCEAVLYGEQGHPWGRFGAALTVLGDANGDKLTDVAIGAPGEQENQGAVYLFHGTSGPGISPSHSQRITGSQLSPRLQYFGQSLSGGQDLTQDGLVDLAVGARGHVLLLRSLPVLNVGVAMRFTPSKVAKAVYQCWEEVPTTLEAADATVCLTIHKSSLDQLGDLQSSVTYDLALDPGRLISRAIFDETKNRTLTRRETLGLGHHCKTMKLLLPDCVEDVVSPIILRLNFSLMGEPNPPFQNLRPVLAVGSQDLFIASLPFEKNCGQDRLCEGDLSINLSFSGLQTLVVGSSLELNVTVTVWNEGEDSYGSMINFYYPAGLSYRRVLGSQGTFIVTFDVSYKANLGDKLLLMANASSENNKPTSSKTTFQLELPVKYAVYTVISRIWSVTTQRKEKVNNLSQRDLAISINFWVPILLNGVAVWEVAVVAPSQNCSIADCLRFRCDIPSFSIQEELDFILKGNLSFGWVKQTLQKKVLVMSVAEITFDRSVYSQLPGQEAFLRAQMEMVLEEYEVYDPIPLIVGSSVGGLLLLALITATLYKLGFFKRQYKEMLHNKPEDTATFSGEDFGYEATDLPLS
ncbi:hypothetical protein HPG69_005156 [Diceros bicornis minor]|uniref:VWFA domain-containing protein n=1 Tax=Diceros bicornis minor TaxID=77932 RepID=A0A7J7EFW4_DICBM|nr:hypothetical protein HPG69_005156 [Diceros bicornis minor]